jgi:hypothetical protein
VIQHIDVHAVLQESSFAGYTDLVTRATGRVVRERIERVISGYVAPRITRMDFSGVGCMDYSCADEIVAKLLRAQPALLVLRGIRDGHREAIEPVLIHHGLAVVLEGPDGALETLGSPEVAAELLDRLVTEGLARRESGGILALAVP